MPACALSRQRIYVSPLHYSGCNAAILHQHRLQKHCMYSLIDTDSTSRWRWLHQHPHRVHPHQESSPLRAEASNGPSWRLAAATCHFLRHKVAVKLGQGAFATLHRQINASGEGTFLTCEIMSALVILHQAPSSERAVRIR